MAPNIYTIHIDSYRTSVKLGWSKEERICSQLVIINFILTIVAPNVPSSDHIHDTIDYDEIVNAIEGHISIGEWRLIEKLVFDLAHLILEKFPIVAGITVAVKKNVIAHTSGVTVEYTASRDE